MNQSKQESLSEWGKRIIPAFAIPPQCDFAFSIFQLNCGDPGPIAQVCVRLLPARQQRRAEAHSLGGGWQPPGNNGPDRVQFLKITRYPAKSEKQQNFNILVWCFRYFLPQFGRISSFFFFFWKYFGKFAGLRQLSSISCNSHKILRKSQRKVSKCFQQCEIVLQKVANFGVWTHCGMQKCADREALIQNEYLVLSTTCIFDYI